MEMNQVGSEDVFSKFIKYFFVTFPVVIYFAFINKYALNIPHWDDYDAVLDFLNNYKTAGLSDKVKLLFSQHNEHRIFSSRLAYVMHKGLFGNINFKNVIYFNFGILVALYWLLVRNIRQLLPIHWPLVAFVFSICLFDINNYENADFAMAGMQNYGIILFFILSMTLYASSSNIALVGAVLFQMVAVFSSGNGGVASALILLFTILHGGRKQIIIAAIIFLLITPLYYIDYHKPQAGFFTLDPTKFIPFFLHAFGAHFGEYVGPLFAILMLAITGIVAPFSRSDGGFLFGFRRETAMLTCLVLFVLGSMGIMAIFRGNLPIQAAYSSRYFIYSHLMVALLFFFYMYKFKEHRLTNNVSVGLVLFLLLVFARNYNDGKKNFEGFYNNMKTVKFDYPDPARAKAITDRACEFNIYCIEDAKKEIK
jgi:hypothetical protein